MAKNHQTKKPITLSHRGMPWVPTIESLDMFSPDFMEDGRNQPGPQEREELFEPPAESKAVMIQ